MNLVPPQMKFLRHLLGITKLDKEKKQSIKGKTGAQNIVKEIKQYKKKWLTTRTEDGHKQNTKTSTTIFTILMAIDIIYCCVKLSAHIIVFYRCTSNTTECPLAKAH